MATPTHIQLSTDDTGVVKVKDQTQETADLTSELLQRNHDEHNLFFNADGFHNHIAHHLLSQYGVGAPASSIQKAWDTNSSYQKPRLASNPQIVESLSQSEGFLKHLGNMSRTGDYLDFFTAELEKRGVEETLKEYLFSGTEVSEAMFGRLFAGFLHPIIHLGFGLEFNQPAIVAEALAQAAVHQGWLGPFMLQAEEAAKKNRKAPHDENGGVRQTLPELLDAIRKDEKLRNAAAWKDGNKIRDGIMARAPAEMLSIVAQFSVPPSTEDLERRTAEMIASAVYMTACAQHPSGLKKIKFDFFLMHCVNSSIFWSTFNQLEWLGMEWKVRLLEWKARLDLVMYASRRAPALDKGLDDVVGYVPPDLENAASSWQGIFDRLEALEEDGHAIKLARAVKHGEEVCGKYDAEEWCRIKGGSEMWLKVGNMVVDSVEGEGGEEGKMWVRSCGFEEAWRDVPERKKVGAQTML